MDFWTPDWLKMKLVAALTYKAFQSPQHNIFGTSIMRHRDSQAAVLLPVWSLHLLTVLFMWWVEKWNFLPLFGSKLRWLVEMIVCISFQLPPHKIIWYIQNETWGQSSSCALGCVVLTLTDLSCFFWSKGGGGPSYPWLVQNQADSPPHKQNTQSSTSFIIIGTSIMSNVQQYGSWGLVHICIIRCHIPIVDLCILVIEKAQIIRHVHKNMHAYAYLINIPNLQRCCRHWWQHPSCHQQHQHAHVYPRSKWSCFIIHQHITTHNTHKW